MDPTLRQEAWTLRDDRRFESVIVGFDARDRVRFITGVARPKTVRFDDAVDLAHAVESSAGSVRRVLWTVRPWGFGEPYAVIAIGSSGDFVHYLSLKKIKEGEVEKD